MGKTEYIKSATYPGYKGTICWNVRHPDYQNDTVLVYAPDWQTAIMTAAKIWDRRWQEYAFYAYCIVTKA